MIPRDYITEWRAVAPWVYDEQVEQDLVISRALIEIYSHPLMANALAFRGGTALYKLHVKPAARYSEDIDLVQREPGPIGSIMDALRSTLSPWLGEPQRKQGDGRVTLTYRFQAEGTSQLQLRLKIEINTREHEAFLGLREVPYTVSSRWCEQSATIVTYDLNELLATKLRALYQRRKGRDLFDLALALQNTITDPEKIVDVFRKYMQREGLHVTRAMFERNMLEKLKHPQFGADIRPLLRPAHKWEIGEAYKEVAEKLIVRLPGDPWKGPESKG